jgi:methionyl-tRNA synthetase
MKKKADLKILSNFGQDLKGAKKLNKIVTKILNPLKEKGLIDFKVNIRRRCDFCGKTLTKKDKYKTIGDKDKCEDCQKKKK